MNENIKEIAERLRGLREIMEYSVEAMAEATGITPEEYALREAGEKDFSVTFLGKCVDKFGVDIIDLLSGCPTPIWLSPPICPASRTPPSP